MSRVASFQGDHAIDVPTQLSVHDLSDDFLGRAIKIHKIEGVILLETEYGYTLNAINYGFPKTLFGFVQNNDQYPDGYEKDFVDLTIPAKRTFTLIASVTNTERNYSKGDENRYVTNGTIFKREFDNLWFVVGEDGTIQGSILTFCLAEGSPDGREFVKYSYTVHYSILDSLPIR